MNMGEKYFSDRSIVDQSIATIAENGKPTTNGISIIVQTPPGANDVEIFLEYDELKAAIAQLEDDLKAMPRLSGT